MKINGVDAKELDMQKVEEFIGDKMSARIDLFTIASSLALDLASYKLIMTCVRNAAQTAPHKLTKLIFALGGFGLSSVATNAINKKMKETGETLKIAAAVGKMYKKEKEKNNGESGTSEKGDNENTGSECIDTEEVKA